MTTDMTAAIAELRVARDALEHAIQTTEHAAQNHSASDDDTTSTASSGRALLILELRMRSPEP